MAVEVPTWLNEEFVKHALENSEESSGKVIIEKIDVTKPIAKGDNYICEIFRAKVDYRKSDNSNELLSKSLIVKAPIKGGLYELFIKMGIIQKEVQIYEEYLPKLNKLFGKNDRMTPNMFESTEENVMLLEDLSTEGFVMANRQLQLDYDHCVFALKALAKFHAGSVKIHKSEPKFVEEIGREVFFNENLKETNEEYAKMNFKILAQETKASPALNRFSEMLEGYSENAWEILVTLMKPKETTLNVLNHGDFWVNNMLFRYVDHKPVEIKLIDLQVSRYTTPAVDLTYFFNGSVQEDVRDNRYNDLLQVYVNELNLNLENLGLSEKLSESELRKMMDECEFFGMLVNITLLPVIIGDPRDGVIDMKNVTENDFKNIENNPMKCYYKNERFQKLLEKRLKGLEKSGWF